ncbi:Bardet-Biedl syndrome 4 protein like protein (BBS4-like protein 4) [Strigomonas culicis]|uniref:Bardet-Biedl syndrome 4 protein like protein (BBS4-like protein 4) n=1 Tax=Strigomonas culicis TaxID=28005 RepID=S9W7J6_9TRYP|nr:Bardet-Biedl syndrome 4 protein like protein (BBS4-like protein 4) [Strigomonas culicis]|eukprot:EPY31980.1 Bardet-Biedl syndrome 4 protein like protein (BBS4-like protein 4) [Strigomonas culicis]
MQAQTTPPPTSTSRSQRDDGQGPGAQGTPNPSTAKSARSAKSMEALVAELKDIRERRNWLIHELFTRQEYVDCLHVIEAQLRETAGTCEYALYVKGLLKRMAGELKESLQLLQAAVLVNPETLLNRKQLGRALFLLGRHEEAIFTFEETETIRQAKMLGEDWELPLCAGLCYTYLRRYDEAVEAFMRSVAVQRHDATLLHLGRVLLLQRDYKGALEVYEEALKLSPDNPEVLVLLGQLHLQLGHVPAAFHHFGQCLTLDAVNTKAIIAAASLMEDNGDYDVALRKYRIAVAYLPDSPQLWNNIGVCFFGKRSEYAAIACLRKSVYLGPFEWITHYNLGIVFLTMGRYVSAFHYLSAAISLHGGQYAPAYMFLGVCLSLMNDIENACHAYDRALQLSDDFLFHLNYAVTLFNCGCTAPAAQQLQAFQAVWDTLPPQTRRAQSAAIPGVLRELQARLGQGPAPQELPGTPVPPAPVPLQPLPAAAAGRRRSDLLDPPESSQAVDSRSDSAGSEVRAAAGGQRVVAASLPPA